MRMRTTGLVMALVAALLTPVAARAAVDFSGEWTVRHEYGFAPESDFTSVWDVVQSGTQIDVTIGGVTHVGTIDPDTGAFDVPLPDSVVIVPGVYLCTDNHFFGTVSADGLTMSGRWVDMISASPAFCHDPFDHTFEGARPACGDGGVNTGEACDDGNVVGGDCCAADCQEAAADGAACSDGNDCTTDQCSAGTCASDPVPNGTECSGDGDLCTVDACVAGECNSTPVECGPCQVCGDGVCALPIEAGCQAALSRKASVALSVGKLPGKDKLAWTWKSSGVVERESFGNPRGTTDYTLCVIDHAGGTPTLQVAAAMPAGGTCEGKPCWKEAGTKFQYRDKAATPDGMTSLDLAPGAAAGKGKVVAKGLGAGFGPLAPLTPPVIVRLQHDGGPSCWESTHSTPKLNAGGRFKASSD